MGHATGLRGTGCCRVIEAVGLSWLTPTLAKRDRNPLSGLKAQLETL